PERGRSARRRLARWPSRSAWPWRAAPPRALPKAVSQRGSEVRVLHASLRLSQSITASAMPADKSLTALSQDRVVYGISAASSGPTLREVKDIACGGGVSRRCPRTLGGVPVWGVTD